MEHFEGMVLAMLCVWLYLRHKVLCFRLSLKQQRDLDYSRKMRRSRRRYEEKERLILERLNNLNDQSDEEEDIYLELVS